MYLQKEDIYIESFATKQGKEVAVILFPGAAVMFFHPLKEFSQENIMSVDEFKQNYCSPEFDPYEAEVEIMGLNGLDEIELSIAADYYFDNGTLEKIRKLIK